MSNQQSVKSLIRKLKDSQQYEQLFANSFASLQNTDMKSIFMLDDLSSLFYKKTFKRNYLVCPDPIEYKSDTTVWKETLEWVQLLGETTDTAASHTTAASHATADHATANNNACEFITGLYISHTSKLVWLFDPSYNLIKGMMQSRRPPTILATNSDGIYPAGVTPVNSLFKNNNDLLNNNVMRSLINCDKPADMIFIDGPCHHYSVLWIFIKTQTPRMLLRLSEQGTGTMFILLCWLLFDNIQLFKAPWSGAIYLSVENKKQSVQVQTGLFKYIEAINDEPALNILPDYFLQDSDLQEVLAYIKSKFTHLSKVTEDETQHIGRIVDWVKKV